MLLAQIDAALAEAPENKILAFACNWCSYAGADFAGVSRSEYPPAVRLSAPCVPDEYIRNWCNMSFQGRRSGAGYRLHPPGDCHYLSGNLGPSPSGKIKTQTAAQGINPDRLQLAWISSTEGRAFQQLIQEITHKLGDLKDGNMPAPDSVLDISQSENHKPKTENGIYKWRPKNSSSVSVRI